MRRAAAAVAAGLLALGALGACSSDDDDPQGIDEVFQQAEDIGEGSAPVQVATCETSARTIRTAVAAFRATEVDGAARPTYEEVVAAGLLDPAPGQPWEIAYDAAGEPTATPVAPNPCTEVDLPPP